LSTLSLFFSLLNTGIPISDTMDDLGPVDIVNEMTLEFVDGHLYFQIEMAEVCDSCDTEWRIGFRALGSEANIPELVLSHTMTEIWWDESLNWEYPIHSTTPIPITDQTWVEFISDTTTITYAIPLSDLPKELWFGFNMGIFAKSSIGEDWFGSQWSDDVHLDQDGDALNELEETVQNTDPMDGDSDDDGLLDGIEIQQMTNPILCDTDNDGLNDGLELGVTTASPDTQTGENDCYVGDRQPSTTTDPTLADSDGGGLNDGEEDVNLDGRVGPWETDPNESNDDVDTDNDGILDAIEERCAVGFSTDADGDTLLDTLEGWGDVDEDGIPNFCDEDDDNDGLPSVLEGAGDWDEDGLINAYDTDSDNDGILDGDESIHDADCDNNPSWLDDDPTDGPCADNDLDGLTNAEEIECGTDPNNPDSDNDGILDINDCPNQELDDWNSPNQEWNGPSWESGCGSGSLFLLLFLARNRRNHSSLRV
jgi:hypothetical protein